MKQKGLSLEGLYAELVYRTNKLAEELDTLNGRLDHSEKLNKELISILNKLSQQEEPETAPPINKKALEDLPLSEDLTLSE